MPSTSSWPWPSRVWAKGPLGNSATGTRTRVARVRAEYPSQLDYSGSCTRVSMLIHCCYKCQSERRWCYRQKAQGATHIWCTAVIARVVHAHCVYDLLLPSALDAMGTRGTSRWNPTREASALL